MSDAKTFSRFGYADISISSNANSRNSETLVYAERNITVPANSTISRTIGNLFSNVTIGTALLSSGSLTLVATSDFLGTIKTSMYGFLVFRNATTTLNSLGTIYGNSSIEIGNTTTGGLDLTAALSLPNLVVTLDYTDGVSDVTDGNLFLYVTRIN